MMKMNDKNFKLLLSLLTRQAERETLDYVMEGMRESFGEQHPDEKDVAAYLKDQSRKTKLNTQQQLIAMHKLLEAAEINFRTTCDLLRYRMFRDAGVVKNMDEFLQLFHRESGE